MKELFTSLEIDLTQLRICVEHLKTYARVSAVTSTAPELFGILAAEKARRAILVTIGQFTPDAQTFAADRPLELIDGILPRGLIG